MRNASVKKIRIRRRMIIPLDRVPYLEMSTSSSLLSDDNVLWQPNRKCALQPPDRHLAIQEPGTRKRAFAALRNTSRIAWPTFENGTDTYPYGKLADARSAGPIAYPAGDGGSRSRNDEGH